MAILMATEDGAVLATTVYSYTVSFAKLHFREVSAAPAGEGLWGTPTKRVAVLFRALTVPARAGRKVSVSRGESLASSTNARYLPRFLQL